MNKLLHFHPFENGENTCYLRVNMINFCYLQYEYQIDGREKKKKLTGNIILIRTGRIVSNFYLLPYKFLFNVKLLHPKSYYSNSSAWYPEQLNSPFVFDRWNIYPIQLQLKSMSCIIFSSILLRIKFSSSFFSSEKFNSIKECTHLNRQKIEQLPLFI